MVKKTVNIRVFEESYKRLKIRAVKERRQLMEVVDELSRV